MKYCVDTMKLFSKMYLTYLLTISSIMDTYRQIQLESYYAICGDILSCLLPRSIFKSQFSQISE